MILNLSGDVNYEMFNELVKATNNLREKDKLHVYFTTQGGMTDVAEAMIDFINKNKELIGITFYGEIFSAGMFIYLRTGCEKWILPDTRGMYHFAWQQMIISEGGKPVDDYDIFCMKEMKESKSRTIEFLKSTKLNEKEINQIKRGKDVYFSYKRMKELIDGK